MSKTCSSFIIFITTVFEFYLTTMPAHSQGASAYLQLASASWPTSLLVADATHCSRGQVIQYAWCNTCRHLTGRRSVCLATG